MTDTAKPIVSDLQIQAARDEATEIIIDTNLTPRQLLEQRDDLEAALFQLYNYALNRGSDDDFPLQISILIRQSYEAALAKCRKGQTND